MVLFRDWSCGFFFTATAPTDIYTLSLHDALPIWRERHVAVGQPRGEVARGSVHEVGAQALLRDPEHGTDRKSTRLNSSHTVISYAVFCLKKKKYPQQRKQHQHVDSSRSDSESTPQ